MNKECQTSRTENLLVADVIPKFTRRNCTNLCSTGSVVVGFLEVYSLELSFHPKVYIVANYYNSLGLLSFTTMRPLALQL